MNVSWVRTLNIFNRPQRGQTNTAAKNDVMHKLNQLRLNCFKKHTIPEFLMEFNGDKNLGRIIQYYNKIQRVNKTKKKINEKNISLLNLTKMAIHRFKVGFPLYFGLKFTTQQISICSS